MASGGVSKKGLPSNGNYKHRQNPQDQQWTLLPNNLDLRGSSRSSKKQRNKEDYPTESSPQYNIMPSSNSNHHMSTPNKAPTGSRQNEQQFLADVETGYQNVFRQHGEQHSHYQSQHSTDAKGRKMPENSGRKLYKENNIQKIPDTNAIVERLGHLRDYMKDVTSVMGSLEKSDDPATREQKKKLSHMLRQLQQEEQQYFNLLQQMLSANDEQLPDVSDDANAISNSVELNARENNGEIEETIEHGEKLLKKMMESQEKMQSLKKQEADLLAMQKEAENKLAEAKAFHSTLMKREQAARNENERYSFPAEWNYRGQDNPSYGGGEGISNDTQTREKCPIGVSVNIDRLSEGDHSHAIRSNNEELAPTGFEAAFENLKHRLQHLKDMSNNNPSEQQDEQIAVEPIEAGDSKMEWHRKKLENKLKELQEKKKHMDTMLVELSALEQASAEIKNGHTSSNQLKTADSSIEEAQHLLDTIDAREKMKKLEEMKESLKQLRSIVNSIQPSTNAELLPPSNEDHIETISNSSRSSSQIAHHRADTPKSHQFQQPNSQPKKDNIRRDKSNKFPVRRHYEAEGRANEDGDSNLPSSSTRTSISNMDDSWENDPQIQEKVRKLQDAKEKLQRVQGLMSAIENSKGTDYPSTLEYLQLLSAISDEDKQEEELQQENRLNSNDSKACHEGETVPNHQDLERLDAVEERMQEQERELEKLMEERVQLLLMQNQLTKIQQQFKNSSEDRLRLQQKSLNQSCSNSNSSSSRGLSPCHQARAENCLSGRQNLPYETPTHTNSNMKSHTEGRMSVTKKDNINSMSANLSGRVKRGKDDQAIEDSSPNATIDSLLMQGNDLDHTMTLHELKQNVLLEDILRQNHNKRGYSHNEDIRSQSCSSANSEFQEGSNSVLAPDTTVAATWGGSSTQNDLEDEHVESLEEQEGSEVEVPHGENIWQPQNRLSPSQQTFRRERAHSEQDSESQIRRDNRLGSHNFKGDHINRWNARKNFHHKQQRNQLPSSSNQDAHGNLCAANRLNTEEAGQPQNLLTPDGTCNTTVWQQFTHHIHQQLEHMNTLCQSIFHDQQALTTCFLSSSLSSPLAVGRSSRPVLSDNWLQNTYQFQQQQQLLLSLSQCYHMIHLQQLEIQYLHQCLQQHPDAEQAVVQASPVINQEHVPEEFTFRPWITAPSANTQGSFPSVQNSSVPTSTFVQSNVDSNLMPIMSNSASNSFNISPQTSNCNFAGQNSVTATLNNQVPPRTRANNFWDNFRSYSRQNMLSTSKSNEALSTNISAPQLQSPSTDNLVSASSWSHRPQPRSQPSVENTTQTNCLKGRRVPNTKLQEIMIKSKKPNSSKDRRQTGYTNKPMSTQQPVLKPKFPSGKDFQLRETPPIFGTCPLQNASTSTESTHSFFQPSSDRRTGELEQRGSGNVNAMQESVYSEVSKIISQAEGKPDLLLDFLKKLKHLSLDSQQTSAILNPSVASEHQITISRSEPSQVTSIGSSTGAVRKRTSNKRPKAEHTSVPLINSGGNAQCSEGSNEKIIRTEKQEVHISTEPELDIMPEQEERGAVGLDISSAVGQLVVNRSAQIAEEDMVYECDPEGEAEPDVEAETDDTKDLAEADQSPGQRDHSQHFRQAESLPIVGATGTLFSNSPSRTETTSVVVTSSDTVMACSDEQVDAAIAMGDAVHVQPATDDLPTVDELILDDIPTKLTALSEEEVQRQMAEEVVATSLLHDVLSEELPDIAKEQGTGPF